MIQLLLLNNIIFGKKKINILYIDYIIFRLSVFISRQLWNPI